MRRDKHLADDADAFGNLETELIVLSDKPNPYTHYLITNDQKFHFIPTNHTVSQRSYAEPFACFFKRASDPHFFVIQAASASVRGQLCEQLASNRFVVAYLNACSPLEGVIVCR